MVLNNQHLKSYIREFNEWLNDIESPDVYLYNLAESNAFNKGIYLVHPIAELVKTDTECYVNLSNKSGIQIKINLTDTVNLYQSVSEINGKVTYTLIKSCMDDSRPKLINKAYQLYVDSVIRSDIRHWLAHAPESIVPFSYNQLSDLCDKLLVSLSCMKDSYELKDVSLTGRIIVVHDKTLYATGEYDCVKYKMESLTYPIPVTTFSGLMETLSLMYRDPTVQVMYNYVRRLTK